MNIHGPRNGAAGDPKHRESDGSEAPFGYFAGACVVIFLVACGMVSVIRYWRWAARVKWGAKRGSQVPRVWEGYWGWE